MTVLGFIYLFVYLYIHLKQHTHNVVSQLYSCILKDRIKGLLLMSVENQWPQSKGRRFRIHHNSVSTQVFLVFKLKEIKGLLRGRENEKCNSKFVGESRFEAICELSE